MSNDNSHAVILPSSAEAAVHPKRTSNRSPLSSQAAEVLGMRSSIGRQLKHCTGSHAFWMTFIPQEKQEDAKFKRELSNDHDG